MEDGVQFNIAWDHMAFLHASIVDLASHWRETAQVALLRSKWTCISFVMAVILRASCHCHPVESNLGAASLGFPMPVSESVGGSAAYHLIDMG
jgi:hypothetical protein